MSDRFRGENHNVWPGMRLGESAFFEVGRFRTRTIPDML
jgi:hypothetical protein